MNWQIKKFEDLTTKELYSLLQLRSEVFVVEQACIFQDMDGFDEYCWHLMCFNDKQVIAASRLVPPKIIYQEVSIGRVVNAPKFRGNGFGKMLMQKSIEQCNQLFNHPSIRIGAQLYLKKFYENFGFVQVSDPYLEDGILHIYMLRAADSPL